MTDLTKVTALIGKGAEYLYQTRLCDEDHLPHGRRSYVWPLFRWLYEHDKDETWMRKARSVADELLPTVRRNPSGEMVIFPGLHHRRNYSTNAIDCGTFVDSFLILKCFSGVSTILRRCGRFSRCRYGQEDLKYARN